MRSTSRLVLAVLAGAGLAVPPAAPLAAQPAQESAVAGFESAGSLLRKCKEASSYSRNYCFAYLAAVADAARSYRIWIGSGDPCLPAGVPLGRLADTFEKYLIDNPSLTRAQAASVVVASLQEAFPCPVPVQPTIRLPAPAPASRPAPAAGAVPPGTRPAARAPAAPRPSQ